jgi:hypothetical protein
VLSLRVERQPDPPFGQVQRTGHGQRRAVREAGAATGAAGAMASASVLNGVLLAVEFDGVYPAMPLARDGYRRGSQEKNRRAASMPTTPQMPTISRCPPSKPLPVGEK